MSKHGDFNYMNTQQFRTSLDKNNDQHPEEIRIERINGNVNMYESLNNQNAHTDVYDTLKEKTENDKTARLPHTVIVYVLLALSVASLTLSIAGITVAVISSNKVASQLDKIESTKIILEGNMAKLHPQDNKSVDEKDFTVDAGKTIVFTATGARGSDPLIFPNIINNYGDSYNSTSGLFTCNVPGIYYFATTLTKGFGTETDMVHCYIYIKWNEQIGTVQDPYKTDSDKDGYSITFSGTFHLKTNDTVHVGCPSGAVALHEGYNKLNSFTGFLLTADY